MQLLNDAETSMLSTSGLSKSFGGLRAVRGVDFTLRPHELHAVIGPNGAGKSTFVNLLAGELRPSAGRIFLEGREITLTPVHRRAHIGIARSFQRSEIFKELSVLENVRLAVQAVALPTPRLFKAPMHEPELVERARAALLRAGLPHGHQRLASTLAHGLKRRLEIAMTLASRPKVLMLDEPLAGMGPEDGERMAILLKSLAKDHAVLLIEHDMDFVFKVADRVTVLVEGAVLATGTPADVRANADVQTAYLGGHA